MYIIFQNVIKDLDVEFTYKLDYNYEVTFLHIYLLVYLLNVGLLNHTNPFPYNTRFLLRTYFSNMSCYLKYYCPHNWPVHKSKILSLKKWIGMLITKQNKYQFLFKFFICLAKSTFMPCQSKDVTPSTLLDGTTRWRHQVLLNFWYPITKLHAITKCKAIIFIFTAMRASNCCISMAVRPPSTAYVQQGHSSLPQTQCLTSCYHFTHTSVPFKVWWHSLISPFIPKIQTKVDSFLN
jgi:hypothetical protein